VIRALEILGFEQVMAIGTHSGILRQARVLPEEFIENL
jgi:predicted RNA binding protein YcfA (HicA-like mRNA interferase family)